MISAMGSMVDVTEATYASLEASSDDTTQSRGGGLGLVDRDNAGEGADSVSGEDTTTDDLAVRGSRSGLNGNTNHEDDKAEREGMSGQRVHDSPSLCQSTTHEMRLVRRRP